MIIGISGYIGSGKDTVAKMIQLLTLYHNPSALSKRMIQTWREQYSDTQFCLEWMKSIYDDKNVCIQSDWQVRKFAGKLKQIVSLLTGIPLEDLEKQEVKDSELGEEWWTFRNPTGKNGTSKESFVVPYHKDAVPMLGEGRIIKTKVRDLLQRLGTDAMRDVIHPNIHVNALFADYKFEGCKNTGETCDTPNGNCNSEKCYPNWIISDLRFPNEMEAVKERFGVTLRINRTERIGGSDTQPTIKGVIPHPSETSLDSAEFDYVIENNLGIPELLEQVKQFCLHFKLI